VRFKVSEPDAQSAPEELFVFKPAEGVELVKEITSPREKMVRGLQGEQVRAVKLGAKDGKTVSLGSFLGKPVLLDFWATWCAPCVQEMPEIQTMLRMYGHRAFEVVTVSINYPDEQAGALVALQKLHATSRNLILGSTDIYTLLAAFDPDWNAAVPYTMLIKPNGEVVYKNQGPINPLELRRIIISSLPDDDYLGHQAYWQSQPPRQPD